MAAPASAALLTVLALFLLRRSANFANPFVGLIVALAVTGVTVFLILVALPAGRKSLQDFRSIYALIIRRQKADIAS
jgi:hypothetical protein